MSFFSYFVDGRWRILVQDSTGRFLSMCHNMCLTACSRLLNVCLFGWNGVTFRFTGFVFILARNITSLICSSTHKASSAKVIFWIL
jgi:hypothetical protein